ncbi:nucleotide-binding domain-containing protein [Aureobasidium pullulans]|nr:nucleotide-binding domain-containing protein [Aureobasidium pullulans]
MLLVFRVTGIDILHLSLHDLNDHLSASQASRVQVLGNLFAERVMLSGFLVEVGHRLVDFKLDLGEDELVERFRGGWLYIGALSYEAGAIWPYRFVTATWNTLLQEYPNQLTIETNTPVVSIEKDPAGNAYTVYTNRGIIHCTHIVHATNAWMSHLLPSFKTKATGVRAHMSAQNPGHHSYQTFHGDRSWSIIYGENDYDYMTQRPSAKGMGDIMLDGGTFRSKDDGINQIGVWDDSCIDALTSAHLASILPIVFSRDNKEGGMEQQSRYLQQHWSGIIALTADSLPFVGKLDGRLSGRKSQRHSADSSEWISAGYNGQGMVFAWLCGTALASQGCERLCSCRAK